jgi:hypothetical protein
MRDLQNISRPDSLTIMRILPLKSSSPILLDFGLLSSQKLAFSLVNSQLGGKPNCNSNGSDQPIVLPFTINSERFYIDVDLRRS